MRKRKLEEGRKRKLEEGRNRKLEEGRQRKEHNRATHTHDRLVMHHLQTKMNLIYIGRWNRADLKRKLKEWRVTKQTSDTGAK
jgi:hypothetical protein